jgi:isopentenyl diphosphate isomerase/L-lactate dehydrogenase-like FMN-dependent dehydrogenase
VDASLEVGMTRRAAHAFGTLFIVSSATRPTLEEIAAALESPKIFQLYIRGDWDWIKGMIDRIKAVGYQGFCRTVDSALYSRREAGPRHGASAPVGRRFLVCTSAATKARCAWSHPLVSSSEAVW